MSTQYTCRGKRICKMNMTLETLFYVDTEKGCHSEDACRCDNELVHELTEKKK